MYECSIYSQSQVILTEDRFFLGTFNILKILLSPLKLEALMTALKQLSDVIFLLQELCVNSRTTSWTRNCLDISRHIFYRDLDTDTSDFVGYVLIS